MPRLIALFLPAVFLVVSCVAETETETQATAPPTPRVTATARPTPQPTDEPTVAIATPEATTVPSASALLDTLAVEPEYGGRDMSGPSLSMTGDICATLLAPTPTQAFCSIRLSATWITSSPPKNRFRGMGVGCRPPTGIRQRRFKPRCHTRLREPLQGRSRFGRVVGPRWKRRLRRCFPDGSGVVLSGVEVGRGKGCLWSVCGRTREGRTLVRARRVSCRRPNASSRVVHVESDRTNNTYCHHRPKNRFQTPPPLNPATNAILPTRPACPICPTTRSTATTWQQAKSRSESLSRELTPIDWTGTEMEAVANPAQLLLRPLPDPPKDLQRRGHARTTESWKSRFQPRNPHPSQLRTRTASIREMRWCVRREADQSFCQTLPTIATTMSMPNSSVKTLIIIPAMASPLP